MLLKKSLVALSLLLFSSSSVLLNGKKAKIVALLQVKNEALYIDQCLRALNYIVDAMVILDDASTDSTPRILKTLAHELPIESIITHTENAWLNHSERNNRQELLDEGRRIGGTHFVMIDADEMFTSLCVKDDWLRKKILKLHKGQMLKGPMVNLWGDPFHYRIDDEYNPRSDRWFAKPLVLCDDGHCNYNDNRSWAVSGIIHVSSDPRNRTVRHNRHRNQFITDIDYNLIHLKCVNLTSVETKRVWYMCFEFIRMKRNSPGTSSHEIAAIINNYYLNKEFADMLPEQQNKVLLEKVPDAWYQYYPFFDPSAYTHYLHSRQREVEEWFKEWSPSYFKDLDIWDVDWVKKASHKK